MVIPVLEVQTEEPVVWMDEVLERSQSLELARCHWEVTVDMTKIDH